MLESAWAAADVLSVLDLAGPAMHGLQIRWDEIRETLVSGAFASSEYVSVRVLHAALSSQTSEALGREWDNYSAIVEADGPSDAVHGLAEGDDGYLRYVKPG